MEIEHQKRAFDLCKSLTSLLALHYSWLLGCSITQILARLQPIRRSPDNRSICFHYRTCHFPHADQAAVAGFLLDQFLNGTDPVHQSTILERCDLPLRIKISAILRDTTAYQQGLIVSNGEGLYQWVIPRDEAS